MTKRLKPVSWAIPVLVIVMGVSPLVSDTLLLKNGRTFEGTFHGGNTRTVRFQVDGIVRTFSVSDIGDLQFGSSFDTPTSTAPRRFAPFQNALFEMHYPTNWQVARDGDSATFTPPNGLVSGNRQLAYGVIVNLFRPENLYYPYNRLSAGTLDKSIGQLLEWLRESNPAMREIGTRQSIEIDGSRVVSLKLANDSPLGGRETNWLLVTSRRNGEMLYFLFTAPEGEFANYEQTIFQPMRSSIRLTR